LPEVQALGEPLGEFRYLELGCVVVPVMVLPLVVFPVLFWILFHLYPPPPGGLPIAHFVIYVSALVVSYGILYFWAPRARVVVCANGILTFQGGVRAHRWEDIVAVYQGRRPTFLGPSFQFPYRRLVVVSHTGTFVLDARYERFSVLAHWIHCEVTRVLFPAAEKDYRAGREVSFECVTVSRAGLRCQSESTPWSKIRKVTVRPEEIAFYDDESDPLLALPLGRIANPLLLADLLRLEIAPTEDFTVRGQFLSPPP
jgi:hypothetical protein